MDARLLVPLSLLILVAPADAAAPADASLDLAGWTWGARWSANAASLAHAHAPTVACVLGDIDADGAVDVLVRTKAQAGARLVALAGPDHVRVLWDAQATLASHLRCGADAAGDGIPDPVLEALADATTSLPQDGAPVASTTARATLQALDGAAGSALVLLEAEETANGGGAQALEGGRRVDVALEPAARDLFLFVTAEVTRAGGELPLVELALSSRGSQATFQVLDAAGEAKATIETPAGAELLAHASVADADGARVLLLASTQASPFDQVPAQAARLVAHATDGSALWTYELDPRADDVLLVPRAGDLDGDGAVDVILETIPPDLRSALPSPQAASSTLAVVSGATGRALLTRAVDEGLLVALPFGALGGAAGAQEALLVVTQATPTAGIVVECVVDGDARWTAEVAPGARPVAARLDPYTGALAGFHDITGDGAVDLAVTSVTSEGATLAVLSGADGAIAWSTQVDASARVEALAGEAGAALVVLEQPEGAKEVALRVLEGATGALHWSATLPLPEEIPDAQASFLAAVTAEGAWIVLTIAGAEVDAAASADATEHVYVLDAATGATTMSRATLAEAAAPAPLVLTAAATAEPGPLAKAPGLPVVALVAAMGAIALAGRRARPKD